MATRVNEAAKLGFKRCIIPRNNLGRLNDKSGIEVIGVSNVNEMLDTILGGKANEGRSK
jgi:DNA repair protein RadA/Sms